MLGLIYAGFVLFGWLILFALIIRYYNTLGYPLKGGGGRVSPDHLFTAYSFAIIEKPFWGKEHRYYLFELRAGPPTNTGDGTVLREVQMEPLIGEPFLMPRGEPAFSLKWAPGNAAVTFTAQGIALTLQK